MHHHLRLIFYIFTFFPFSSDQVPALSFCHFCLSILIETTFDFATFKSVYLQFSISLTDVYILNESRSASIIDRFLHRIRLENMLCIIYLQ